MRMVIPRLGERSRRSIPHSTSLTSERRNVWTLLMTSMMDKDGRQRQCMCIYCIGTLAVTRKIQVSLISRTDPKNNCLQYSLM